jgi:hypothetical protein
VTLDSVFHQCIRGIENFMAGNMPTDKEREVFQVYGYRQSRNERSAQVRMSYGTYRVTVTRVRPGNPNGA